MQGQALSFVGRVPILPEQPGLPTGALFPILVNQPDYIDSAHQVI